MSDGDRGTVVAIIPARGGSKGIPSKNLQLVGGVSLVSRAISAAIRAEVFGIVAVSTDDEAIAAESRRAGARVIDRPAELSTDESSSESALSHALESLESEGISTTVVAMIQATSPFIEPSDLRAAVKRVRDGSEDSVFSATATHRFLWTATDDGARGVNHDHAVRLRRQDLEPQYEETGAFYVMSTEGYVKARHRFFGRIGIQEVDQRWAIDIDAPADLDLARSLAADGDFVNGSILGDVSAIVTDFDGVHTDDAAYVDESGRESVRVSRADGFGIEMLRAAGLPVLIVSRESNSVVSARAAKLGAEVVQSVRDKETVVTSWARERGIPLDRIVYVGNDVADIPAMRIVGWPAAVADARPEVTRIARIRLQSRGGYGAIRELADMVIATRES